MARRRARLGAIGALGGLGGVVGESNLAIAGTKPSILSISYSKLNGSIDSKSTEARHTFLALFELRHGEGNGVRGLGGVRGVLACISCRLSDIGFFFLGG